jgi:hypothetical protein
MRLVRVLGGAACLLGLVPSAWPQSALYEAAVAVPETEVRCLPSDKPAAYPTGKLRQGAVVTVVQEREDGWLAIKPPPGSFSWVQSRFLQPRNDTSGVILGDDVEVRIGSELVGAAPNVRQVRLSRSDPVVLLRGTPQTDEDGSVWVMIQPPASEVRYIRKDAVRATGAVKAATGEPPTGGGPVAPAARPAGVAEDPTWAEAEKAEREGRPADAEKLYLQLAKQTPDHELRIRCYNRIHTMHQAVRQPPPAAPPGAGERLVPAPASLAGGTTTPPGTPAARATSQYTYVRETPPLSVASTPATDWRSPGAAAPASGSQSRGPGVLVRSNLRVFDQPGYLLDLGKDRPAVYVVPQPGVNLEPYVGKSVSVSGPVCYHTGYRKECVRAVQVTPYQ